METKDNSCTSGVLSQKSHNVTWTTLFLHLMLIATSLLLKGTDGANILVLINMSQELSYGSILSHLSGLYARIIQIIFTLLLFKSTDHSTIISMDDHKLLQKSSLTLWQKCRVPIMSYI